MIFHDRSFLTRCTYTTLAAFLAWSMAAVVPSTARAAELPMGLATGSKEAYMAIDGKQWASLPGSSNPVYEGTTIRTGKGTASVLLKDGTQLELQPRTVVGLSGSRMVPIVKIAVGGVFFRVPFTSQATLVTPSVRYQTTASDQQKGGTAIVRVAASTPSSTDLVGEIVVNPRGGARLGLQKGEMLANSVSDPGLHIIKAGQSVYIPQVGASDPSFRALLAQALPGEPSSLPIGAIPAYGLDGKSVGYITADSSFVSSPGSTPNLPNPIPPDTIPPDANIPPGAMPIFTVHSPAVYAGYILDDKLVAYLPLGGEGVAGGVGVGVGAGAGTGTGVGLLVGLGVIGAGVGLGVGLQGDNDKSSSPSIP
jgi:hypothetical protein